MAGRFVTIKVKAGIALMKRIHEVCSYLEVTPANFIEYAIQNELQAQEAHRIKEDIALEELRSRVLASGQSMEAPAEEAQENAPVCELCLAPVEKPRRKIQGPLLCDNCLDLAKGPPLESLEQPPE